MSLLAPAAKSGTPVHLRQFYILLEVFQLAFNKVLNSFKSLNHSCLFCRETDRCIWQPIPLPR